MDTARDGAGRLVGNANKQCAVASSWPAAAGPGIRDFIYQRTPPFVVVHMTGPCCIVHHVRWRCCILSAVQRRSGTADLALVRFALIRGLFLYEQYRHPTREMVEDVTEVFIQLTNTNMTSLRLDSSPSLTRKFSARILTVTSFDRPTLYRPLSASGLAYAFGGSAMRGAIISRPRGTRG